MLIGIDGSEANEKVKVGSGQYAREILWSFYRINKIRKTRSDFIIFLKQDNIEGLPEENSWWKYEKIPSEGLWILKKLIPRLYKKPKPDVFFSPNHYLPILTPIPQVCTIHDLGYLMFTEQFRKKDFWQLKYWTAISIIISEYIICVSHSVEKEIVRRYPFASKKLKVVHHGFDSVKFNTKIDPMLVRRVKNRFKLAKNYILYLGTVKPSKNIGNIIKAFEKLQSKSDKFRDFDLVIAGKRGWMYEDVIKTTENRVSGKVKYLGYVSEEDKPALIRGARFLISPSYWEGFGMHVIESMACGIPVVVSKIDALKEVVGEAGIYVETDTDSIRRGMEKVLSMNKMEYNILVQRSLKQVERYSWDKAGKLTLEILEKVKKS